uniref:hypothetical protein n=1 Tax=Phocaeicola coprophilus TaxID=387090 RepID=UPI00307A6172
MKAYYIYIIGIILCISSCKNHSQEWEKLQDVETYIETNADSALVTLQNIQPENLANDSKLTLTINKQPISDWFKEQFGKMQQSMKSKGFRL